jgi:hypothetical protein
MVRAAVDQQRRCFERNDKDYAVSKSHITLEEEQDRKHILHRN